MELIKEALSKSKASIERSPIREHRDATVAITAPKRFASNPVLAAPTSWTPPRVMLNDRYLENQRIISFAMNDPTHLAFNVLRTRVRKETKDNGWSSIAVTSPSPGCGKTVVALNLAFSLARAPECRVVLIDLDLRRSAVARHLGIRAKGSIVEHLEGKVAAEDCFVQVSENLIVGLNSTSVEHSSEIMQSPRMFELISAVTTFLAPDIVLFDLPPMGTSDDALAFLPKVDTTLLVIAAGATIATEVDECERQIRQVQKLLGIVLNKCEERTEKYY